MKSFPMEDRPDLKVMRTPRSADIAVTHQCNLRCDYCSHFSSAGDVGKDLSLEEWLQFFEELGRCTVMNVTLQGGEPFYRKDIRELLVGIVENRMRFSILSNGTLVTEQMAAFIASSNRCDTVQVSVDGSDAAAHDIFRGEGSFRKAVRGIQRLRKYGVPVSVRVTIHRRNLDDLDKIADFLLKELELPGFSTNAASFMGLCRRNSAFVQLTPRERSRAMEALLRLSQKYPGRISANAGPLADALNWTQMQQALRDGRKKTGGYLTGCGGPFETIAVRADGAMVPCIQMGHIELGRINRDDLESVWRNHPELKNLRQRRHRSLRDVQHCNGCSYIDYCTGNCPALAYLLVGDADHPSPDACLKDFLEKGGVLPDTSCCPS